MKNIAIIDDEKIILNSLSKLVAKIEPNANIDCFLNLNDLLNQVKNVCIYDAYLIDIFLDDDPSGIKLANQILDFHKGASIIFISGKPRGTFDVYDAQHIYFIEKPVSESSLKKALNRINDINKKQVLDVKFMNSTLYIPYLDIVYIESVGRKAIIHTHYDAHQTYIKLNDLLEKIPSYFKKVHKSYIVNTQYIKEYNLKSITLTNGKKVNISRIHWHEEIK